MGTLCGQTNKALKDCVKVLSLNLAQELRKSLQIWKQVQDTALPTLCFPILPPTDQLSAQNFLSSTFHNLSITG